MFAITTTVVSGIVLLHASTAYAQQTQQQLHPDSSGKSQFTSLADFNFPGFSEDCANGSAALNRWVAQERARVRFGASKGGAGTLASEPVKVDAAGCVRLPGSDTRLPLDVMVDSHYYAARLYVGQFGRRRTSRSEVLDALTAEIWSNLLPGDFRSQYGQSQMLTIRRLLAASGWYETNYDHVKFAHDVYHFYHRRWRSALLSGLLLDENGDGCLSLAEYARSLCLQQRYMSGALQRSGRQTRALRRVVRMLSFYQRMAAMR